MSQNSKEPTRPSGPRPANTVDLTPVDLLVAVFLSGIGIIIGVLRLLQGRPGAGTMIGVSLLFAVIWVVAKAILFSLQ